MSTPILPYSLAIVLIVLIRVVYEAITTIAGSTPLIDCPDTKPTRGNYYVTYHVTCVDCPDVFPGVTFASATTRSDCRCGTDWPVDRLLFVMLLSFNYIKESFTT